MNCYTEISGEEFHFLMAHGLREPGEKEIFTNDRNVLCHFSFQSNFLSTESSCAFFHSDNSEISGAHSS